jgi:hypothetical protein
MKIAVARNSPRTAHMLGADCRDAANDEPAFLRTPEHDRRVWRGDSFNGNAWINTTTGDRVLFCVGRDPNAGRWDLKAWHAELNELRAIRAREDGNG